MNVLSDNLAHDVSPVQEISPLSPSHDYQDVHEHITMHDVPVLEEPAVPSDIPQGARDDSIIAGDILLEVHIPLSGTSDVSDRPSVATHIDKPVSHSTLVFILELYPVYLRWVCSRDMLFALLRALTWVSLEMWQYST